MLPPKPECTPPPPRECQPMPMLLTERWVIKAMSAELRFYKALSGEKGKKGNYPSGIKESKAEESLP